MVPWKNYRHCMPFWKPSSRTIVDDPTWPEETVMSFPSDSYHEKRNHSPCLSPHQCSFPCTDAAIVVNLAYPSWSDGGKIVVTNAFARAKPGDLVWVMKLWP